MKIKRIGLYIVISLIFISIILGAAYTIFGSEIKTVVGLIDTMTIKATEKKLEEVKLDLENNTLSDYPEYGDQYGTMLIPNIDVELPLFYGDTLSILQKGIGHSSGSYFPGEGGSVLMMGHNYSGYIRDLHKLNNGDEITIETTYGEFSYQIYDSKIIKETDFDAVPIQREKEILMLYTCHPLDMLGHPVERLVVYADLIEGGISNG